MTRPFIIAEIGINHDGSSAKAQQLIAAASGAGADAVKFQYRNLSNVYLNTAREIGDEILSQEINKNYLAPGVILELAEHARGLGVQAGISFFDATDMADFGSAIERFDFFKIPSAELSNAPLIDAMLDTGRHTFISTGCHSEAEVERALARLSRDNWTPLHCISNYPTTLQNARLGYLTHLRERWHRAVGYSSHDDHWEVCLLALQLGAAVIERHITLDKGARGLDHSSSSTPDEFARLSAFADNLDFLQSGDGPRVPNQGELLNRQNLGRSFFAGRGLAAGERVCLESLVYRSPKVGLGRDEIEPFLGQALTVAVRKGAAITPGLFRAPTPLPARVIEWARERKLALPVRLHDLQLFQAEFPIGAYEFHLSFEEVRTDLDVSAIDRSNRYSIHLPDYVNSTQLMDPFATDAGQREGSLDLLERTVRFAQRLQDLTGKDVPVVGSFSVVHTDLEEFFSNHAKLLARYRGRGVLIMPQWLPPIAWYFGGSVRLHAMNSLRDAALLKEFEVPLCMDLCHLFMGSSFFRFSASQIFEDLRPNIRHIHIADAAGVDGEGLQIGDGDPNNLPLIRAALAHDCLKVIEVWQGHLDRGAGFRTALNRLAELSNV